MIFPVILYMYVLCIIGTGSFVTVSSFRIVIINSFRRGVNGHTHGHTILWRCDAEFKNMDTQTKNQCLESL